jgi:hypothetical protein
MQPDYSIYDGIYMRGYPSGTPGAESFPDRDIYNNNNPEFREFLRGNGDKRLWRGTKFNVARDGQQYSIFRDFESIGMDFEG